MGEAISAHCVHVLRRGMTFDPHWPSHMLPRRCAPGSRRRPAGRVRAGHGVDSERLAVRLRSARQNKHRRLCCGLQLHNGPRPEMHRALPPPIEAAMGSKDERGALITATFLRTTRVLRKRSYRTLPRLPAKVQESNIMSTFRIDSQIKTILSKKNLFKWRKKNHCVIDL